MSKDAVWDARAKGLLKAELARRGVTYAQLAEKLQAIGINETTASITNKINRGRFTAVFLLQCLAVLDCRSLELR